MRNSERTQTRFKLVNFLSQVMHNFCFRLDCALKRQFTQFEHRFGWLRTRSLQHQQRQQDCNWRVNSSSAVVVVPLFCQTVALSCCCFASVALSSAPPCVLGSLQALWYDDGWFVGLIVNILPPLARCWCYSVNVFNVERLCARSCRLLANNISCSFRWWTFVSV